jgi:hypothetical protein
MSNADWVLGYEVGYKAALSLDTFPAAVTIVHEVNDILDGTKANIGTSSEPWQSLRQRLYDIRTLLGIAERIVGQVEYDHNSKFYLNISQWYKVRRDYERRVQGIRAAKLAKEKQ